MTDGRRRVVLAPAAQRQLRRLPPGDAARLRGPILFLALDQTPPGATKLTGTDFWRLRVADLRIVYVVDEVTIIVLRVARRSESTYRRIDRLQRVEHGRIVIDVVPGQHRRSLAGTLRGKVGRTPKDEDWESLRDAAWRSPDPDRAE